MMIFEEDDARFYIAPSTVDLAGNGLFAKRAIKKNEWLEITGVLVQRESVADKCTAYANSYKFASNVKRVGEKIDIGEFLIVPLGFAGIVNHAKERSQQNVEIRYLDEKYTKKSIHADKAVYWFIRDVSAGEEILGNYGDGWDKVFNWMHETHEAKKADVKDWEKFLEYDLYNLGDLIK